VVENRVLRRICGPERKKITKKKEVGGNCIMSSFIICTLHQILIG
jgi:hypothetical protein